MITLYHNSRCSKSRQALELLEKSGEEFRVREYLKDPLSGAELLVLLGKVQEPLGLIVRSKDEKYKELNFDLFSKEAIAKNLATHPELLERPIAEKGDIVVVGRPIENLKKIF